MKVKKFKFKQILKLHLLNSKAYEHALKKTNSGFLTDSNLTQVIGDLKKALHIIFEYHQADKIILFIGVPKKLEVKINKLTKHLAIPKTFELQGVISGNLKPSIVGRESKWALSNVHFKFLLPKLLKKPDLVVLFDHEKKQNIITESYVSKVPLINFDSKTVSKNLWVDNSYNLQGIGNAAMQTSNKNLIFSGLNFLFKSLKKNKI